MDDDTSLPDMEVEPKVAARMQLLNDQSFHQFTNLKIMKSDDGGEKKPRRKLSPPKKTETIAKDEKDPRIYSQDFRTLKILPADTINFNEIELIGEDLYFGNKLQEESEISPPEGSSAASTEDSLMGNEDTVTSESSNEIKELLENQTMANEGELDNLLLRNREDQRSSSTTAAADDHHLDQLVIANTVTVPGDEEERGGKLLLGSEDGDDYSRVEDLDDEEYDDYYYDDEYEILRRNKGQRKYKR